MTDLLKDLEAVVAQYNLAGAIPPSNARNDVATSANHAATFFFIAHHAEIAEAVRDARRYRFLKEHAPDSGMWSDESIDAAMHPIAQEGK